MTLPRYLQVSPVAAFTALDDDDTAAYRALLGRWLIDLALLLQGARTGHRRHRFHHSGHWDNDEFLALTGLTALDVAGSDEADEDWVHELADNRFALPGATPLEDFNARFHANFEVEDIRTLGGLVLHHFGELPSEGASIEIWPFRFTAQRIDANRIVEILVELLPGAKPNALENGIEPTPPPEAGSESVAPDEPARP